MITLNDFEKVYRDNYMRLFYYAFDILNDSEAAKDAVNEAAYSLWNRHESINPDKANGMLFVTVKNTCLNVLRKKKVRQNYEEYVIATSDKTEDIETLNQKEERIAKIQAELQKMSPRMRFVLEQCYFHNKKYKDVAELLSITTDGVKKHVSRGLAILREQLNVKKT